MAKLLGPSLGALRDNFASSQDGSEVAQLWPHLEAMSGEQPGPGQAKGRYTQTGRRDVSVGVSDLRFNYAAPVIPPLRRPRSVDGKARAGALLNPMVLTL